MIKKVILVISTRKLVTGLTALTLKVITNYNLKRSTHSAFTADPCYVRWVRLGVKFKPFDLETIVNKVVLDDQKFKLKSNRLTTLMFLALHQLFLLSVHNLLINQLL